jgi:hypothetical protein
MRTIKLILALTVLSVSTLSFAQSEYRVNPFSVTLPLTNAINNDELVKVMHAELKPDFLFDNENNTDIYTAQVNYEGTDYAIYGSKAEWLVFFHIKVNGIEKQLKKVAIQSFM